MKTINYFLFLSILTLGGCANSTESVDTQKAWVQRERWEIITPKIADANSNSEYSRLPHGK